MDIAAFNFIDYGVFAVLIISGILATFRGFIRELLGVVGWVLAVVVARLTKPLMIDWLEDSITKESLVDVLAWLMPFIACALVWFVAANMIAPGLKKMAMGALDRPFGFVFGFFRGAVLISALYISVIFLTESEENFPESVLVSASIVPIRVISTAMLGFAPEDIQNTVEHAIPDQDFDDVKKRLAPAAEEQLENAQDATKDAVENTGNLLPDEQ
jgi:membrane protein required for colicin V production